MGNSPYVLRSVMNPNGGAIIRARRKERSSSINLQWPPSIQRAASDILADYGPLVFGNRPVRTRTPGGVGAGGEKPPATRLAIRFESFVESDNALRSMPVERQREEDLLWYSRMHKPRHVLEPEFLVVIRVSHQTTSVSIHIFQT